MPVREEAVVQTEQADQPLMYQVDLPGNTDQVTGTSNLAFLMKCYMRYAIARLSSMPMNQQS